jgi:hypothetical protein
MGKTVEIFEPNLNSGARPQTIPDWLSTLT